MGAHRARGRHRAIGGSYFTNVRWIDQLYVLHVLDHPRRNTLGPRAVPLIIPNRRIGVEGNDPKR